MVTKARKTGKKIGAAHPPAANAPTANPVTAGITQALDDNGIPDYMSDPTIALDVLISAGIRNGMDRLLGNAAIHKVLQARAKE